MFIAEIIPNLLYGGGTLNDEGWKFIQNRVTAILNISTYPDHPPFDFVGRIYIWAPILDEATPELTWVITLTQQMNVLLTNGWVTYVHDRAGHNRLGFILAAYFMQRYGYSRDQALFMLRLKKPDLAPKAHYMALLARFQDYLAGK
jgi:protein-tyrosine phosphatase